MANEKWKWENGKRKLSRRKRKKKKGKKKNVRKTARGYEIQTTPVHKLQAEGIVMGESTVEACVGC